MNEKERKENQNYKKVAKFISDQNGSTINSTNIL